MDDQDRLDRLDRLRMRAHQRAKRSSFPSEAEDFGSFVILKSLEGSTATIDQMWVDYMRERHGDSRSEYRKGQQRIFPAQLNKNMPDGKPTGLQLELEYYMGFICKNGAWFSQRERSVFIMRYQWQMSFEEIAFCFGISSGRVSQICEHVEFRIKTYIERQTEGM
jgi:hypothetical protein